jgi:hypothetical protein
VSHHCNGVGDGSQATSPTPTVSPKVINSDAVDLDEEFAKYEAELASEELGKIEELEERVKEAELGLEKRDDGVVVVRNVETPTTAEVEAHEASGHANFKRWCPACQKGFAQRDAHRSKSDKRKRTSFGEIKVPECETPEKGMSKFSIDYMKMEDDSENTCKSCVVMVNHEDGGIFSYPTPGKGIQGDAYWVAKRLAKDIDGCGGAEVKVQVKSDQELAIVVLQEEIKFLRKGRTMCVNSPVGESECNGRAENAVRRVQVKFRTIRAFLEAKFGR